MQIYFIRHGERLRQGTDQDSPLSPAGREQVFRLAQSLVLTGPPVFFASSFRHALETADLLSRNLPYPVREVMKLTALTPHTPEEKFNWESIAEESRRGCDWRAVKCVVCVGHEPQLSQLVEQITHSKIRQLGHAEAAMVEVEDIENIRKNPGTLTRRLTGGEPEPVTEKEKTLQPKIQSKMQVSSFLAGFTFTALITALTQDGYWSSSSGLPQIFAVIAIALLTWATALFVVAIYMFDRLTLPREFWEPGGKRAWRPGPSFPNDFSAHGEVYAHMVWTWKYVFTVAVFLAVLGFVFLVLHRQHYALIGTVIAGLIAAGIYYWKARPNLGVD